MKIGDKRGQYFLIAAAIIAIVLFALAGVTNKLITRSSEERAYDLAKELNLESVSVVNQGIISDPTTLGDKLETFVEDYGPYAGEGKEVYFIYGNLTDVSVYFYDPDESAGTINLDGSTIDVTSGGVKIIPPNSISGNQVKIVVDNYTYDFELKEGENFFFILQANKKNGEIEAK